jgi:hypothetical protein
LGQSRDGEEGRDEFCGNHFGNVEIAGDQVEMQVKLQGESKTSRSVYLVESDEQQVQRATVGNRSKLKTWMVRKT